MVDVLSYVFPSQLLNDEEPENGLEGGAVGNELLTQPTSPPSPPFNPGGGPQKLLFWFIFNGQ